MFEMAIFRYDVICIRGNRTIHKFIVVLIYIMQQMEPEMRLAITDSRMTRNSLYDVCSHFR